MVLQTISETTRSNSLTTDTVSCLDLGREQDILLQSQAQKAALQVNCLLHERTFQMWGGNFNSKLLAASSTQLFQQILLDN
jgi:hypothetical protein